MEPLKHARENSFAIPFSILTALILGYFALATDLSAQISPGDLATPHEEIEGITNCVKCHELGEGVTAQKCLACHTPLASRLDRNEGYHHQVVNVERGECTQCHSDHGGRDLELVRWPNGKKSFNHQLTGYKLEGKHAKADCELCHRPAFMQSDFLTAYQAADLKRTSLGLSSACLSCHLNEHRDQLGVDCRSCHSYEEWVPADGFDHAKADFPLAGKHQKVECLKCHAEIEGVTTRSPDGKEDSVYAHYRQVEFSSCLSCHQDPHRNTLGDNCQSCHSVEGWRPARGFDHNVTKFPLTGKHVPLDCKKCHKEVKRPTDSKDKDAIFAAFRGLKHDNCSSCHKDIHGDRLGPDCASCHNTTGWKSLAEGSFNHDSAAYPLKGRHQKVACEKCHGDRKEMKKLKFEFCADCHRDVHLGQFISRADGGLCESCHTEQGFVPAQYTVEQHNQEARFSLTGAHLAQPCRLCHTILTDSDGAEYRRFKFTEAPTATGQNDFDKNNCLYCHNDLHLGQFSDSQPVKECTMCHTGDSWVVLKFDHNTDATFALEGKHATTACAECHRTERLKGTEFARYRPLESACQACHSLETLKLLERK